MVISMIKNKRLILCIHISTGALCSPRRWGDGFIFPDQKHFLPPGLGLALGCCSTLPHLGPVVWTSRWWDAWRSHSLRTTALPWNHSETCGPSPTPPQTVACPTGDHALSWRDKHKKTLWETQYRGNTMMQGNYCLSRTFSFMIFFRFLLDFYFYIKYIS